MREVSKEEFHNTMNNSKLDIIYPRSRIAFRPGGYSSGYYEYRISRKTFGFCEDFQHGKVSKYYLQD